MCDKKAVVVEFQQPIRGLELALPDKSERTAKFFCKADSPDDFPFDAPKRKQKAVIAEVPDDHDGEAIDYHEKYFGGDKTGHGAPRIDPAWEQASPGCPPGGSNVTNRIRCCECEHVHRPKDRKLWNGSYSYCPKCGHDVHVPVWDEED